MKIPRSLHLPRKLKKELKKGFTRNVHQTTPTFSGNPDKISVSSYFFYTYSGNNTKSFYRLCKFSRKEEKRNLQKIFHDTIIHQMNLEIGDELNAYSYDKRDLIIKEMQNYDYPVLKYPNIHIGLPNL